MKRLLIILTLVLIAATSFANDAVTKFQCETATISIFNSNIIESPFFVVTVNTKRGVNYYPFLVEQEFFQTRCEKNADGKNYLLINNFCGGSGCSNSNYELIDLTTGKEVLKTRTDLGSNSSEAESILKKHLVPFSCSRYTKTQTVPNDKGEFCFISALELG